MSDAAPTEAERLLRIAEALGDPDHPTKVATSAWAQANLGRGDLVEADRGSVFAVDDWRRCADRGLLGLFVPTSLGGSGDDLASCLLTLEGLGHGCRDNGLTYALASQVLSTQIALARFGSSAQQTRWLPGLMDGTTFAAFAMTEPDSGSDAFAMSTRAEELPDGRFRLDGHKSYVTFAPICDVVIVFAVTDPAAGNWGISAFVVDATTTGVTRSAVRPKMGMRTTPFGDIHLDDVVVGPDALLGRPGAGASIFSAVLDVERSFVLAPQIGAMERQLEESIDYARSRVQGGSPIGRHQAVSHRIVAMKERHERARLFLYRAALAHALGRRVPMYSALAKVAASDVAVESALDAARLQGARGYVSEFEIERGVRDAIGGLTYSGTSDVLRNVVARHLGVG